METITNVFLVILAIYKYLHAFKAVQMDSIQIKLYKNVLLVILHVKLAAEVQTLIVYHVTVPNYYKTINVLIIVIQITI